MATTTPRYKPSESRYSGGGKTVYLVYSSPGRVSSGRRLDRIRAKRMYFPANARDIKVERPGSFKRRTGRSVYGVAVHYRSRLPETRSRRGQTSFKVPERWISRTRIVDLPSEATGVRLTASPPKGPRMAVR